MLTLVIALLSCIGVIVASVLNHRAVTTAAKIAAGDMICFDAALIAALAQLEAAQLQHETAVEVARIQAAATIRGRAPGARLSATYGACTGGGLTERAARSHAPTVIAREGASEGPE